MRCLLDGTQRNLQRGRCRALPLPLFLPMPAAAVGEAAGGGRGGCGACALHADDDRLAGSQRGAHALRGGVDLGREEKLLEEAKVLAPEDRRVVLVPHAIDGGLAVLLRLAPLRALEQIRPQRARGIVGAPLLVRERAGDRIEGRAIEREAARHQEAARLELHRQDLTGADAAAPEGSRELRRAVERQVGAPQVQPRQVAHRGHVGRAGRGAVEHARRRKLLLQPVDGLGRLGGRRVPCAGERGARRAVDLIEGDDTVEAVAAPVEQLLQPPRGGEQRVGDDEDALLELDARVRLPARL